MLSDILMPSLICSAVISVIYCVYIVLKVKYINGVYKKECSKFVGHYEGGKRYWKDF